MGWYNILFAVLTAVTIVLGMRMMGAMLISSLIIFPALTSMGILKSFLGVVVASGLISICCFVAGMIISYEWSIPAGASVVLVNLGVFLLCTCFRTDVYKRQTAVKEIVEMGAWIVGGCCGTTSEHMRKTVELCKEISPVPIQKKEKTVVTSWSHGVEIGKDPVIIGERINPTGKSRLKQALKDYDLDYLLQEGVAQQENRAHILDVNVGLPGINEPEMMEEVVKELQSVLDLPLQIDTSDPEAMERAMRVYNGKPMVLSLIHI